MTAGAELDASAVVIRPVAPTDLPRVVELCAQHAEYERAHYVREAKAAALARAWFAEDASGGCTVAQVEKQIVGYASYATEFSTWAASDFLYLDCLFIEAPFRGRGIGHALLSAVAERARERGCDEVQWQTPSWNDGAIRFYQRLGAHGSEKVRFSWSVGA